MATANKSGNLYLKLVPIMLSFFAMSFVDLVGTGTNFIKKDFGLSDTMAGLFPLMVFLWFLIFSVPTGLLMNRIGRRKTVLISLVVTALALLLPVLTIPMPHNTASFTIMLVSFCLLGIGNAIMQVSLNPLLSNIVHGDRLASALTLGQFVNHEVSVSLHGSFRFSIKLDANISRASSLTTMVRHGVALPV